MSGTPEFDVQCALYTRLTGDATLTTKLGGAAKIIDRVPEKPGVVAFPYITFADMPNVDWSSHTFDGIDGDVTINTWSRAHGKKEAKEIHKIVYDLLHNHKLVVPGFLTALLQHSNSNVLQDPDGVTYHGVQIFTILIGGDST